MNEISTSIPVPVAAVPDPELTAPEPESTVTESKPTGPESGLAVPEPEPAVPEPGLAGPELESTVLKPVHAVSVPLPVFPEPVPYQWSLCEYLKTEEADLWKWFSSNRVRQEHAENVRLHLLKSTYRIESETQPTLYSRARDLAERFGIDAPLTIYQAHSAGEMNAALAYDPGEVHLILHGAVQTSLTPVELDAMLAHELSHFLLYHKWGGDFFVSREIVHALSNDRAADPCHMQTARFWQLYEEIFADRGSLLAIGDLSASVSTLVKLHTGLSEVSAESYFRQAEEIFSKGHAGTQQLTHPEPYIRARALQLWETQRADGELEISRMIEGHAALDSLDLLGKKKVAQATRRLIDRCFTLPVLRTEVLLGHARQFFDDFAVADADSLPSDDAGIFAGDLEIIDQSLRDYYCYVLLDFATADRNLDDLPLSAALVTSRQVGLGERFSEIAAKELGMPKKRFAKIEAGAQKRVDQALASPGEPALAESSPANATGPKTQEEAES
jgi:Zn-dependent protease with chaperone function